MNRVGLMQGRLLPRFVDRLQCFPLETWIEELDLARQLGVDCIEWLFALEEAEHNPLGSAEGRRAIRQHIERARMPVSSVCADYLKLRQLSDADDEARKESARVLRQLIEWAAQIGASRVLLPLLEEAALDSEDKQALALDSIARAIPTAERHQVIMGLEMELCGEAYARIVSRLDHPLVRATYDTGNSTAQGFDIAQDIEPLLPLLAAVHIKDRVVGGGSCMLGSGDANFAGFFSRLIDAGFEGDLILEPFVGDEPVQNTRRNLAFVQEQLARAMGQRP
jgi:L-ribulose-5-phosphate 3-epimerase